MLKVALSNCKFRHSGHFFVAATLTGGLLDAQHCVGRTELSEQPKNEGDNEAETVFETIMAFRVAADFTSISGSVLLEFVAFRSDGAGGSSEKLVEKPPKLYAEGSLRVAQLLENPTSNNKASVGKCVLRDRPPLFPLLAKGDELGSIVVQLGLDDYSLTAAE